MKNFGWGIAAFGLLFVSCNQSSDSRSKSFVGLEAEIDPEVLKGGAPSYLYLQQWFKKELPVNHELAQAGGIPYQVHGEFSQQTLDVLPKEFSAKLTAYLLQQVDRVNEFQNNQRNPARLKELLALESAEMADILMALIDVNYEPKTNDLLAALISHKPLRNFVDRYSVELLEKLYKRSQFDLIVGMDRERANFTSILIKNYISSDGANQKFVTSLNDNCAKLKRMLASMNRTGNINCNDAGGLNLDGGIGNLNSNANSLGGPAGSLLGMLGGLGSPNGFAPKSSGRPQLRVFAGKDLNTGASRSSAGSMAPSNLGAGVGPGAVNQPFPNNSSGSNGQLISLLQKLLSGVGMNSGLGFFLDESKHSIQKEIPQRPKGRCKDKTGFSLITCQRHLETLRPIKELLSGENSNSQRSTPSSSKQGFNLNGRHNLRLISDYYTSVQNQGMQGACTAYANAHVIGTIAKSMGRSGEYDGERIWAAQRQVPSMPYSVAAVQSMNFDGLRVTGAQPISTDVESLKRQLDSGRPVYYGSTVDDSWDGGYGGMLDCKYYDPNSGHAYALVGYDDRLGAFVVKNSWGDYWGDQGYGYLPYRCIDVQGDKEAFDIRLQ